jgi:hypothetical protein
MKHIPAVSFLFMFVCWVGRSVEAKVWRSEELAVGQWDVTLRGGWFFDPSSIFPRNSNLRSKTTNGEEDAVQVQRRLWGSSMDCCLSLCQDGTFVLAPGTSAAAATQRRLTLRGQWDILSNPYCITDRFYDQLQLQSYSRATRARKGSPRSGSMDLSCRMWGRFVKSKPIGRKGTMTHGTLVWKDGGKKSGPRRIVASFSAKRASSEPSHKGWEDQDFFGY